jgi:hypothetical protein
MSELKQAVTAAAVGTQASDESSDAKRARSGSNDPKPKDDIRVNLAFAASQEEFVDGLADAFNKRSRPQLFELALTVLSWAEAEMRQGRAVGSFDESTDTFRELAIPGYLYNKSRPGVAA